MQKRFMFTIVLTQLILSSSAQESVSDHGSIAVRFAAGISTLHDDANQDRFGYKPSFSLSVYPIIKVKEKLDLLIALSVENKGAYNKINKQKIEMNYANLLFAPSFHFPNYNSRLMAGVYTGLLIKKEYISGETYYHPYFSSNMDLEYIFKGWDFGAALSYEMILFSGKKTTIGMDIRTQYSILNIYDSENFNRSMVRSFTQARNFSHTLGLNLRIK
jgi:hypothetical protein